MAALWPTTAAPVSETRHLAPLGAVCSPFGRQAIWPLDTRVHALACWLLWGMPDPANLAGWGSAVVAREIAVACALTGLDDEENETGPNGALNRAIYVLTNGDEEATRTRVALAKAIESGEVAPRTIAGICRCGDSTNEQPGGTPGRVACGECGDASGRPMIAVVESDHIGALGLGYCLAPIVVAAMPPGPTPEHVHHVVVNGPSFADRTCAGCVLGPRKYTVAAWSPSLVDFAGLKSALNEAEFASHCAYGRGEIPPSSWGGSASILGSPQGVGSTLPIEQVLAIVRRFVKAST